MAEEEKNKQDKQDKHPSNKIDFSLTIEEVEELKNKLAAHESIQIALQVRDGNERILLINKLDKMLPKG